MHSDTHGGQKANVDMRLIELFTILLFKTFTYLLKAMRHDVYDGLRYSSADVVALLLVTVT